MTPLSSPVGYPDRDPENGYPNGELREAPDSGASFLSGMCGKRRACDACPSTTLCSMKASVEKQILEEREREWEANE